MPAGRKKPANKRRAPAGLGPALAVLAAVFVFRIPFFLLPRFFDSDDAVNGLMALSIQRGAPPLYYWGQGYLNTVTPALTAVFLWLLPCGQAAVKLTSLVLHLGAACVLARLILRATGSRAIAGGALVLTALLPLPLSGMVMGAGSPAARNLTVLCGLACWALFLRDRGVLTALAFGLLAGIGYWNEPTILLFVLPVAVFALREWGTSPGGANEKRLLKWAAVAGIGFLAGAGPHFYGASRGLASFRPAAEFLRIVEAGPRLKVLFLEALPRALTAGVSADESGAARVLIPAASVIILGLLALMVVFSHIEAYAPGRGKVKELVLLADLLGVGFCLAWVVGPSAEAGSGRYAVILWPAIVIWSALGFPRLARRRPVRAAALPAIYVLSLVLSAPSYWKLSGTWEVETAPAFALLEEEELKGAFANYWASNLMTLASRESVIVAQLTGVPLRHARYYALLEKMDRVGYLFNPGRFPEDEKMLAWTQEALGRAAVTFSVKRKDGWILVAPDGRGLSTRAVNDLRLRPGREELRRKIEELEAYRSLRNASRISR